MSRAIAWFARNHVAANLLMAFMLIGGINTPPVEAQASIPAA